MPERERLPNRRAAAELIHLEHGGLPMDGHSRRFADGRSCGDLPRCGEGIATCRVGARRRARRLSRASERLPARHSAPCPRRAVRRGRLALLWR